MASVNTAPGDSGGNFLGYSRGADPNRSLETLLSGAGRVVTGAVDAFDQYKQRQIRSDVIKAKDEVDDVFGINKAADISADVMGPGGSKTPQEISEAKSYLSRLSNAFSTGTIKESHYWGKLEDHVKQLRSRYPGYREQIDNIVADVTGATPANALRQSLIGEMKTAMQESDASSAKLQAFVDSHGAQIMRANPALYEQYITTGDSSLGPQLRHAAHSVLADEETMAAKKAKMEADMAQGRLNEDDATAMLHTEISDYLNTSLASFLGTETPESFMNQMKAMQASDNRVTPEEAEQLLNMLGAFKAQGNAHIEANIINGAWSETGTAYPTVITDQTKLDAGRDLFNKQIDNLINMVTNEQYGLFAQNAVISKHIRDGAMRDLLKNDFLTNVDSIQTLMGPDFVDIMARSPEGAKFLDALSENASMMVNTLLTGGQIDNLNDGFNRLSEEGIKDPEAYKALILKQKEILLSPEVPRAAFEQAATVLFGEKNNGFLQQVHPRNNGRIKAFAQIASPEVTNRMVEIGGQQFEDYKRWTKDNFANLFDDKTATIGNMFDELEKSGAELVLNEDNLQLEFNQPDGSPADINQLQRQELLSMEVARDVKALNQYLLLMDPILSANGGDAVTEASSMLSYMGIELTADQLESGEETKDNKTASGNVSGEYDINIPHQAATADPEIRDAIGIAEGAGYDTWSGGASVNITAMKVSEVRALQDQGGVPGAISSAAGKYQIIDSTLQMVIDAGILDPDEPFDEEAQDRAADYLMMRRGYNQYKSGKISKKQFLKNLSKEWASIPNPDTGQSNYANDGVNKATKGGRAIEALLDD